MIEQTITRRAVIVTALGLEYNAVRSYLTDITESTHHGTIYETGTFTTPTSAWQVTILETGMGNTNSAVETERAINRHQPDVALFVGIAGGLKDASIGDVIAATQVYGYEAGKQANEFLARPNVGTSSYDLVQRAKAEARRTTWHALLTQTSPDLPCVFIGPIAAGEKVLTNSTAPLRAFLNEHYNDALAIEMEGRGFLAATYANTHTKSIVIRGISDFLDGKAASDAAGNQALAARNASAFAYHLLATIELSNLTLEERSNITAHRSADMNTASISPTEREALKTVLQSARFHERVLRLIDDISKISHHFITNTARPPEYTTATNALRSAFNNDYDEFRNTMSTSRSVLAALNQTTTPGTAARQRLLDAIRKVEEAVQRLVENAHEVFASQNTQPNDDARHAADRLSAFVARRLTHPSTPDGTKTLVFLSQGGTCRDPMAKAIFDQLLDTVNPRPEITVLAAGLGPIREAHASIAANHAIKTLYGKDLLKDHVPTLLTPELTADADIILAMDHKLLSKTLPPEKTYLLTEFLGSHGDIDDPYPDGRDAETLARYKSCAEQLRTLLTLNVDRILDALSI